MRECNYCGERVSQAFKRVFADDRGNVYGCPNCEPSPIKTQN